MRKSLLAPMIFLFLGAVPAFAQGATTIDFEQFSGPSVFTGVQPPLTIGVATFSGGQILRGTTFLPADRNSVYGTAFFCPGCQPAITINFSQPVSNFSMLVLNGQTFTVTYTVSDNAGGMQTISLPANFLSGAGTLSLPTSGIHSVNLTSNAGQWDFFVDNVTFTLNGVQVVCRPLDSDPNDKKHIRAKLGRHCYFLITGSDGVPKTYGAYKVSGLLTPAKNQDPVSPLGGCVGGITGSDCISVTLPQGTTIDDLTQRLNQAVARGTQGTYDPVSNNSNLWMKNRIAELGLNVTLPANAITNKSELCAQIPAIKQSLDMCHVGFIDKLLLYLFAPSVTCP